ncbi:MAG: cytochrome b N-terminal domain-containing protein, partial [Thermodesulfobacteriota bacterium]
MLDFIKPERQNWRHYFGGFGLLVLAVQFLTGLVLVFFYEPDLKTAYKSVQYLTNVVTGGSLARNLHRWVAFSVFLAIIVHTIRTTVRLEFLRPQKRLEWLTGVLLVPVLFLLLTTGLILPWEWKGYWLMEMVPNYFAALPVVGPALKGFFLESFTLPRYLAIHILILPVIGLVLIDYHFLVKLRKRGIFRYMLRHMAVTLPFLIAVVVLATSVTIPSNDPEMIPFPLEGEYIPEPEWYVLTLLLPFYYFKGAAVPFLSIVLPLTLLLLFAFLPY